MVSKKVFTVCQPALHDMAKGVFTNKKDLFDAIKQLTEVDKVEFKDVLGYDKKKFNYPNLLNLLSVSHIGDAFRLKLIKGDSIRIIEIRVMQTNKTFNI